MTEPVRRMYHSFPRRRAGEDAVAKGLAILTLILSDGLLLTPEIEHWRDSKIAPGPAEDYVAVSRRCCFTEIAEAELPRHSEYFGAFALEFETRKLVDLGALPVFYVPRTTGTDGYGPGPAIVTQLAHVQDLLSRVSHFRRFAKAASEALPDAPVMAVGDGSGGLALGAPGVDASVTIPAELLERTRQAKPGFSFVPPPSPVSLGISTAVLNSILNLLHWGIHDADALTGTIKALGSILYSTERPDDPFLSHYQQREWRIIGGMKRDERELCTSITSELRAKLIQLDASFFDRTLAFPTGPKKLVDECELFGGSTTEAPILASVTRVIAPTEVLARVQQLVGNEVDVVAVELLRESREARA